MQLKIPGQFRGPECRALMPVTIELRRQLESLFANIPSNEIATVTFILRVGGTLGEFEPLPSSEPESLGEVLTYDVVVPAHPWDQLPAADIRSVVCSCLKPVLSDFVVRCRMSEEGANAILAAVS